MTRRFPDKRRGEGQRKRKPILFLSLEGKNQTEKLYFRALNKDHGERYSIRFAPGRSTDVQNMWAALCQDIKDGFSEADGDKAFCICDVDFEPYKEERIQAIKGEARLANAHVIASNPCFEIWYLNHFQFSTRAYASADELLAAIEARIHGYVKNGDYYLQRLKDKTDKAIENSIRQDHIVNDRDNARGTSAVPQNASTEIFEIVQTIIDG